MTPTKPGGSMRDSRRLRATVATSLLAVFLAIAAIAAMGLWWRYDQALRQGEERIGVETEILARQLAARFATLEAVLYEVAAHNRLIGGPDASPDEWFPVLRTAFAGLTGFTSLSVADARGIVTYSSQPMTMRQPVAEGELQRRLSANPRSDALVFDRLFRDPVEGRVLMPIGRVLRTVNSEFQGMLVVMLLPESLDDLTDATDLGPSAILRVFGPDGQQLVPTPQYSDPLDRPSPEFPLAPPAGDADTTGVIVAPIEAGGEPYLTAYRTMAGSGLTVAVSLPETEILAGWRDETTAAMAGLALVGVVLLLAGFAISRSASSGSAGRT